MCAKPSTGGCPGSIDISIKGPVRGADPATGAAWRGLIYRFTRVAELYRGRRRQLRLTQVELARRAGVVQSSVARLEAGRENVTLATLVQVARALQVDVEIQLVARRRRRAGAGNDAAIRELSPEERNRRVDHILNAHPEVYSAIPLVQQGTDPLQIYVTFRDAARPAILKELEDLAASVLGRGTFYFSYRDQEQPGRYRRWPVPEQGQGWDRVEQG